MRALQHLKLCSIMKFAKGRADPTGRYHALAVALAHNNASPHTLLARARAAFSKGRRESLVFDVGAWMRSWERVRRDWVVADVFEKIAFNLLVNIFAKVAEMSGRSVRLMRDAGA